MLHNDFNHVMKLFSSWLEIKSGVRRFKDFYLRSLTLIVVCEDFNELKLLFCCVFTVALNEEDGLDSSGEATPSHKCETELKNRIAFNQPGDRNELEPFIESDFAQMEEDDTLTEDQNSTSNQGLYMMAAFHKIETIYPECSKQSNSIRGDHNNLHHCPSIAKKLLKFSKFVPCWSRVMNSMFGYGKKTESSATSESLFNELKNQIFHHKQLPIRLDDFVDTHTQFILGNTKILRNKNSSDEDSNAVDDPDLVDSPNQMSIDYPERIDDRNRMDNPERIDDLDQMDNPEQTKNPYRMDNPE